MKFDLTKCEIKKDNILNATYKCIYELGVSGISMRSIAKEAGVNQPMLHYYFKNRENLLTESLRALFDRFTADITKGYKASDPPEKKLDALQVELKEREAKRVNKEKVNYLSGIVFNDFVDNMEKIGDHLTNVAQGVLRHLRWDEEIA